MASSSKQIVFENAGNGPRLAFHTAVEISGLIFVHGGIDKKGSNTPLNGLYSYDPESGIWTTIDCVDNPALSHHCSVALHERYMLLIGGWDGKVRSSEVYVFDTKKNEWFFPKTTGFPSGAGLSSHSATVLSNGDILIIGREGSLRTQRRSGNAFLLKVDIDKGVFLYSDHALGVSSRSGHTTHIIASNLYVYGGRSDKIIEIHSGYKGCKSSKDNKIIEKFLDHCKSNSPMGKAPCGRKHHIALSSNEAVFIHGGETFDGRSREPVAEMFLLKFKPNLEWYNLGKTDFGRAGHICCYSKGKFVLHGGIGGKGSTVFGDTFVLVGGK